MILRTEVTDVFYAFYFLDPSGFRTAVISLESAEIEQLMMQYLGYGILLEVVSQYP